MQQCSKVSNIKKRRLRRRIFFDALPSLRSPFALRLLCVGLPFAYYSLRIRFGLGMQFARSAKLGVPLREISFENYIYLKKSGERSV